MENNKRHKKEKFLGKQKRKKNLWARFSLCTPKGPSVEEKQHMQEVRWDVRKAFSGSICQAREGKGARQTTRERERGREKGWVRETPRTQGRRMSWGNSLCFSRVLLHFSVRLSVRNVQLSSFIQPVWCCEERLVRCGWCHGRLSEVTAGFNTWLLTSFISLYTYYRYVYIRFSTYSMK